MPFQSLMNCLWDKAPQSFLPLKQMQRETIIGHYVTLWIFHFFFLLGWVFLHYVFPPQWKTERGREAGTHYRLHFLYTVLRQSSKKQRTKMTWDRRSDVAFWSHYFLVVCSWYETITDIGVPPVSYQWFSVIFAIGKMIIFKYHLVSVF